MIYVTENKNVDFALSKIDGEISSVDTETNGLDPLAKDAFLALIQIKSNKEIVIFNRSFLNNESDKKIANYLIKKNRKLIMHNAYFDIRWLKVHLKIKKFNQIYCTMIGSQLISCGKVSFGHSLKDLIWNNFQVELNKSIRLSDWTNKELSKEQLKYAAEDVEYLELLREIQIKELCKLKMIKTAEIEMRCIEPVAQMSLNGIKLNTVRWMRNFDRNKIRQIRLEAKISDIFCPKLMLFPNMTAFKVTDRNLIQLLKEDGVKIPIKYNKGTEKETIALDYLEKITDSHPAISLIIKHKSIKKAQTSYGDKWITKINTVTNRLHANIKQIAAETGRMSATEIPIMTVPRENIYRNCFIAEKGNTLIIADYAGQELRIVAELSQDKKMIEAFCNGLDLHTQTASLVFNIPYDRVQEQKILRTRAKNLNFGIVYGIGAKRFAANSEISEEEAQIIIDNYFKNFYGLRDWLNLAKEQAVTYKKSVTMSGRVYKHTFDENNFSQVALAGRNGMNFPVQASAADITKTAMRLVYDSLPKSAMIVNCIHDEIVVECKKEESKEVALVVNQCMVEAGEIFIKSLPTVVDIKISEYWTK